MAKKNSKIQKQLEEGLKNANQVVDQQIEGKAAPNAPKTPAAAAPSAPAAGATPAVPVTPEVAQQTAAQTPERAFEAEIAKVIKGNPAFVKAFRDIRDGVIRGDSPQGLDAKLKDLAQNISNSTKGQIPAVAIEGFLTEKATAQASPAVQQEVAQRAESPVSQPGVVETPPPGETGPSVAQTGLPEASDTTLPPPETKVTATTPGQPGLSPEELAMLQAADEQVSAQREQIEPQKEPAFRISDYFTPEEVAQMKEQGLDPYQEALDIREFGSRKEAERKARLNELGGPKIISQETRDRLRRQDLRERAAAEPEWVKKQRISQIRAARREVLDFGSLNPVDDLYNLFTQFFGVNGLRDFQARNSMLDPESYTRGNTAMRMSLFHFALGYLPPDVANSPQIVGLRKRFDAIMRELGVDQELIDTVRGTVKTQGRDPDTRMPFFGQYESKNVPEQRAAIDEVVRIVEKLKDGGALRHPDVAPALHTLTQIISEMDSDFVNNSYIDFNPRNEYGAKLETQVDNLELVTQQLVDRIQERTGEDLRTVMTPDGDIPRPGWSPLSSNGSAFTTQNAIRYETGSRRRYALDIAGVIDPRWQQVDAQGLDVPSFVNSMHPTPDSTKAAIGFILTTDPTTQLHYAAGGRGRRDTMRESAIIKAVKDYLSGTDYNDTSNTWEDALPGDIGVGDNIEYTLDSSVVQSEVARRRSLLPADRLVIVALDPEKFPIGSTIADGKGNVQGILNDYGIMVLPDGHPLIEQARLNGAGITRPFALGTTIDMTPIVGKGEFASLLIDVDPHVFPAVKHTLPLRDPMGRKGTVALVPQTFLEDTGKDIRIQLRDQNGIPSPRKIIYQTDPNTGEILSIPAPERAKSFSGRGPEGAKAEIPGIKDVQPATQAEGSWEGKPVVLARSIDVSAMSQDWPEGISVGIVANENGDFPNLGTLADRYLADQGEFDVRRRWVVGDMLGVEQGDDRPRGIMTEDPFYGRAHGAVTDAEMERGLAIMREQDALIEAGTAKRDLPPLTPEDEDLLGRVRGRLSTNRKFSPARSPYDADEIFAMSEDQWAVSQRTKVDRKATVSTEEDPFLSEVATQDGVSRGPLSPEVSADVRRLKGKLLYLLTVRATKANFDRINQQKGTRSVGDIIGFAPEIAGIRQELARVGVTAAAIDTFIANVEGRMPALSQEEKVLMQSELAQPMKVTLESVTPVSSLGGLSTSSRGFGTTGRQFLTPEQAGVNKLDRLDQIAYKLASVMASEHQMAREGSSNYLSLDALIESELSRSQENARLADEAKAKVETTDDLASLMQETPAETRTSFVRPAKKTIFSGIKTVEELRTVAKKAYTIYSLFQARDDAGDGWVKFINNVLHADGMASAIGDSWRNTGESALLVDNRLFASRAGEIPTLTTADGREVGFLSKNFIEILRRNTDYGSALIDFAKQNGLEFVLIKTPVRDSSGKVVTTSDEVYITKAEKDASGKKFLNFTDLTDMTSKHGYQALADETSFAKTEERIRTMLKDNGADSLFDVVPTTDNSGRYVLKVRPEALIEFGLFGGDSKRAKQWVDNIGEFGSYSDKHIQRLKILLDSMTKFKFYTDMNSLAVRLGIDTPFPDITLESVHNEVVGIYKDANGITIDGEASGPFGLRRAINSNNQNVPGEGIIPRVISKTPIAAPLESPDDWLRYLASGMPDYTPGADPMLDAALKSNSIRDELARKIVTEGRLGAPEGAGRRVETPTTRAMFRRAKASLSGQKLAGVLNSRAGGFAAGGALSLAMLAMQGQANEENAKQALAFEALGAVNPAASAVASLGFTAMNKGDMLRAIVNLIGGFGGAAAGAVAGSAVLPVAGSFAGGMAGSVAGSTIADNIYSQIVGQGGSQQYVPNNVATVSEQAQKPEKDPFSVYKGLGG